MPLISVIIPVYNSAEFLMACVSSVLRLREIEMECILVDDGSNDGSERLCDIIALNDSRVTVVHQPNSGVSVARNKGAQISRGKYLYFLDSDDICLIDNLKSILSNNYDLYLGLYAIGTPKSHKIVNHIKDIDIHNDILTIEYLCNNINIRIGSLIVSAEILSNNCIHFPDDIKYGEDQEFILKLLSRSSSILLLHELFCIYRTNPKSAMFRISLDRFDVSISRIRLLEYFRQVDNETFSYLKFYGIPNSIISVCESLFRFNMPFKAVKDYLFSNAEISEFLLKLKNEINDDAYNPLYSVYYLKILQLRVLFNKYVYISRCNISRLKHRIEHLLQILK